MTTITKKHNKVQTIKPMSKNKQGHTIRGNLRMDEVYKYLPVLKGQSLRANLAEIDACIKACNVKDPVLTGYQLVLREEYKRLGHKVYMAYVIREWKKDQACMKELGEEKAQQLKHIEQQLDAAVAAHSTHPEIAMEDTLPQEDITHQIFIVDDDALDFDDSETN